MCSLSIPGTVLCTTVTLLTLVVESPDSRSADSSRPAATNGASSGISITDSGTRRASATAVKTSSEQSPSKISLQDGEPTRAPGEVSTQHSRVYVKVGKTGLGHDHGVEGRLRSGVLHLGATQDAGEFVFDMSTFDADGNRARGFVGLDGSTDTSTRQQVNENMHGPDVLNIRRFPTATYTIKSAKLLDRNSRRGLPMYELNGEFSLHGTSRPLMIIVDVETKDGMCHVRGSFNMLQTQFGITPFSKAFGAVGVADKLTVYGDLWVGSESATASRGTSRQ
ncbi:MAG: YceI family protein [Planctomycetaceae bacterium]